MNNKFSKLLILLSASALFVMPIVYKAHAAAGLKISQTPGVDSEPPNKHNLSVFNTGAKYRALADVAGDTRGKQICIFCHTPHNANVVGQAPLWNRKFSDETAFQRYSSETLQIRNIANAEYASDAQPNGSSKLCLSCHDGISKLGVLKTGPEITLANGETVITGNASFKPDTNKMKSGHHPVSFVYNASVRDSIKTSLLPGKNQYQLSNLSQVKVDKQSRMQCTTCHDPHQNQSNDNECYDDNDGVTEVTCDATNRQRKITPFWVYGNNGFASGAAGADQLAVCVSCHPMEALDAGVDYVKPW